MLNKYIISIIFLSLLPASLQAVETKTEEDEYFAAAVEGRVGSFRILDQKLGTQALRDLAFDEAVDHNQIKIVKYLLKNSKISIDFLNIGLCTATKLNNKELVSLLLHHGADVNTKIAGKTPLTVARDKGYNEIARILVEKGATRFTEETRGRYKPQQTAPQFSLSSINWEYMAAAAASLAAIYTANLFNQYIKTHVDSHTTIAQAIGNMRKFGDCSICLEPLAYEIKTLKCKHTFHDKCIGKYLSTAQAEADSFDSWKASVLQPLLQKAYQTTEALSDALYYLIVSSALQSVPTGKQQTYFDSLQEGVWKGLQQICPYCRAHIQETL